MFLFNEYEQFKAVQYNVMNLVDDFMKGYDPETGGVSYIQRKALKKRMADAGRDGPRFDENDNEIEGDGDERAAVAFRYFRLILIEMGVPIEHIVAAAQAE